jgi:dTDP-4-dehydrorhamnose reductase
MSMPDPDRPILLTGRDGQLGYELARTLAPLGPVAATTRTRLDLADEDAIRACVRALKPSLIVNAAAYTAVDRAETERDLAFAVNARAPAVLAEEASRLAIPLVHFSTDYVFDGTPPRDAAGRARPYREDDPPRPLGAYGESKLAGEEAIRAVAGVALILRIAWVYAERGRNFLLTMMRLAMERDEVRVVDDQIGCPTYARLVAEATAQILAASGPADGWRALADRQGIYHLAGAGATSWHGFAAAIFAARAQAGERTPRLTAIPTRDYPTPAARPAYSVLDAGKVRETFGLALPDWQSQLALCLEAWRSKGQG